MAVAEVLVTMLVVVACWLMRASLSSALGFVVDWEKKLPSPDLVRTETEMMQAFKVIFPAMK